MEAAITPFTYPYPSVTGISSAEALAVRPTSPLFENLLPPHPDVKQYIRRDQETADIGGRAERLD